MLSYVAYRLTIKTWAVRGNDKATLKREKERIQGAFRQKLGLRVDMVKQGMGSTNDGNTARRFFANPELTSEITGIDQTLLERMSVILDVINCDQPIDSDKFGAYCAETARLYVQLYGWYYMPNSPHKLLMHGKQIVEQALVPIGALSEEVQEASNKVYKEFRLRFTRKHSRGTTNADVMSRMLVSSDPYIGHLRVTPKRKKYAPNAAMEDLLLPN